MLKLACISCVVASVGAFGHVSPTRAHARVQPASSPRLHPPARPALGACARAWPRPAARSGVRLAGADRPAPSLGAANVAAALAWAGLVTFAFGFAPGAVGDPADTELVMALAAHPLAPFTEGGVSPIFATLFNLFLPVPMMLAALLLSTSRGQRLPALPFVGASLFVGFFSLGPFLALRTPPPPMPAGAEEAQPFGVFESRLFGGAMLALSCSIPISAQLLQVVDVADALREFGALCARSKLVAVSCADLSVLSLTLALLVGEDARRRGIAPANAAAITAASVVLPAIAPAAYLLLRPLGEEVETD
jgi:hypothetical protein